MDAYLESVKVYNQEEGGGGECGSVLARSMEALPLVAHPCLMGVCEGVLGRQVLNMDQSELQRRLRLAGCEEDERIPWQVQVQISFGKPPLPSAGGKPQLLHRDGEYMMLELPAAQIEHEVSVSYMFTHAPSHTRPVYLHLFQMLLRFCPRLTP